MSQLLSRRRVITAIPAAGVGMLLAGARLPAGARQPVAAAGGYPYLTGASAEQVGPTNQGFGTVRVSWTFGDTIPDGIQILQPVPPSPPILWEVAIDTAAQTPESHVLQAVAFPAQINVCPRVVENGITLDRMADADGSEPLYWEAFCIGLPVLSAAVGPEPETTNPPQNDLIPFNLTVEVRKGEFTVFWDAPSAVDHFNARIEPSVAAFQDQIELAGGDRSFTQSGAQAGVTYQFSLQGCTSAGIWGSSCSDWVSIPIEIRPDMGFDPWRPWFQIHRDAVFNQITPVTAVARIPENIALFKVGFDGVVWSTYWEPDAEGWRRWFPLFPEFVFAQEAPITAVSRSPDHLDLYTTGLDGAILSAWWASDGGGWRPWFPIFPEFKFRQDRAVAAVSRRSNHIDLFRVGFDGAILNAWWESDGKSWRPWFPIFPENKFPPEARVTALARTPGNVEVYVMGYDGAVWSAWWSEDGGGWRRWFSIFPETKFAYDQEIVAVSRDSKSVNLFTVGLDGAIWTAWWSDDGGGWRPWSQLFPETRFAPSSRITAVRRGEGIHLFITGLDNAVWSTSWAPNSGGWSPWFSIHPEIVFDQQHPVAGLSRIWNQVDVFKVGFDGAVWSTFWAP